MTNIQKINIFLAACALFATALQAPAQTQNQDNKAVPNLGEAVRRLEEAPGMKGASVGILAVRGGRDTLIDISSDRLLLPASNQKTVTTAAALHKLGGDFRFRTSIGYSGRIEDGILKGDLYIIGGGDPTTGSVNPIAEGLEATFGKWASFVREAGIREIEGWIIGDGRWLPGMMEQESWQLNDSGTYYGSGVSGLSFYENVQDFLVQAGEQPGDSLKIKVKYPLTPWLKYSFPCVTGAKGSGNTLYFYTTGLSPIGEMRGTFAVDRKPRTEQAANKFPEMTCAAYFCDYLERCGIICTEGPADTGLLFGAPECVPQEELTVLGHTESPDLKAIVQVTNRDSNNLYAETLLRTLGKLHGSGSDYKASCTALKRVLKEMGVNPDGMRISDGSGLSREDHLSADFLCSLLGAVLKQPYKDIFIQSLPKPGGEGSIKFIMQEASVAVKDRIRMKSGSMSDVRCFCGYILPKGNPAGTGGVTGSGADATKSVSDDTIIFSLMVNNFTGPLPRIQPFLDGVILALAQCN
ncbi:MAG: D-alanyl-D-alanine carboxypeptidase/D-alanyl-D-alanine-endopeptidase [Candidatus Cryptobacteroides sp.]